MTKYKKLDIDTVSNKINWITKLVGEDNETQVLTRIGVADWEKLRKKEADLEEKYKLKEEINKYVKNNVSIFDWFKVNDLTNGYFKRFRKLSKTNIIADRDTVSEVEMRFANYVSENQSLKGKAVRKFKNLRRKLFKKLGLKLPAPSITGANKKDSDKFTGCFYRANTSAPAKKADNYVVINGNGAAPNTITE